MSRTCRSGGLARRFETHRRTVREALASAVPVPRKVAERASPVLDEWKPVIVGWLIADRDAPRKQRHTARRVWQRLVDEHDVVVGESTVRRYVAEAKRSLPPVVARVMVPQSRPLGAEAEVDFGQVSFVLDGFATEGWMFVMRLSASGRGFHRIYLNQAQQAFLDGHVRAFAHFGGVPGRIRYDNLKPAVVRVLKGRDRAESERFIAMRSHYGFDSSLLLTPRVDVKSRVCVRQCFYSVPVSHVGHRIDVRLGAETVDAFVGRRLVASHTRGSSRKALRASCWITTSKCSPSNRVRCSARPRWPERARPARSVATTTTTGRRRAAVSATRPARELWSRCTLHTVNSPRMRSAPGCELQSRSESSTLTW